MAQTRPRIVLWDVETTHNLVAAFRLLNQDSIPHENVIRERYIVCAAWKDLDREKVSSVSVLDDPKRFKADPSDDYHVVKELHRVLSDADVVVAHNGDQYDIKFTEGRMLYHAMPPLPPILKLDTLKTARERFLLNSNRLDYLGMFLNVGRKIKNPPDLWLRVLRNEPSAIREMLRYNKEDVRLLERVFKRLAPYMSNYVNRQLFGHMEGCPRCGSTEAPLKTIHRSVTQQYERYQCRSCHGWYRSRKALPHKTKHRIL